MVVLRVQLVWRVEWITVVFVRGILLGPNPSASLMIYTLKLTPFVVPIAVEVIERGDLASNLRDRSRGEAIAPPRQGA